MKIAISLLALFFSLNLAAQNGTEKIPTYQLDENLLRQQLFFKGKEQLIRICNLAKGITYKVLAVQSAGSHPKVGLVGGTEPTPDFTFTAESECAELIFRKGEDTEAPCYLSIVGNYTAHKTGLSKNMTGISVEQGIPVEELVLNHLFPNNCLGISNIQGSGDPSTDNVAIGAFSEGSSSIGIDKGIILSTGLAANAEGPNDLNDAGSFLYGSSNDPDLKQLSMSNLFDAVFLEFDFVANSNQININYVFASEEYCEWVSSFANDICGIFISGPGISGAYTNNAENIALLPNTSTYISINNVNHLANSQYFIPNQINCGDTTNMQDIQFDGYTVVISATANLIPLETYHIKFAIADVGDLFYDSALFLEMNPISFPYNIFPDTLTVCTHENEEFELSASPGLNYLWSTGDTTQSIAIDQAGDYWVMQSNDYGCSTVDSFYVNLQITELPPLELGDTLKFCRDSVFDSMHPGPLYEWSTGEITPYAVLPNNAGWVSLKVSDYNNCSYVDSVFVMPLLAGNITSLKPSCGGDPNGEVSINVQNATPPVTYIWNNGSVGDTITNLVPGDYTATITDSNMCETTFTATVPEVPQLSFIINKGLSCPNTPNGWISLLPYGGTGEITYNWSTGDTTALVDSLPAGIYSITATDSIGCTFNLNIEVYQIPEIIAEFTITHPGYNQSNGIIEVTELSGIEPITLTWSTGETGTVGSVLDSLPAGVYTAYLSDGLGCMDTVELVLEEPNAVSEIEELKELHLSPNPAQDEARLTFVLKEPTQLDISVSDAKGQTVARVANDQYFNVGEHQLKLQLEEWPAGLYFINLHSEKGVISRKLVVQ